jgi:putative ABC transport system substrate-binding protein
MRRREFISLITGVAVAWPVALKAQSTDRVRVIGMLSIFGSNDPEENARIRVFEQTLQQLGWAVGRDLKIETREVGSDFDRIPRYATELIALAPDVIFTIGSLPLASLQQATRTIPIVFFNIVDPVGAGFVQSMAHRAATPLALQVLSTA